MTEEAYTEPSIKKENTRCTLETLMWGKLAKRGFYWAFRRKFTTAE
jgi:hypothetical protein